MTAVDSWWHDLGSAALVGTARRPVPPLPVFGATPIALDPDTRAEEALLTSAALGAAALRAGRRAERLTPSPPAPPDAREPAGRLAVQLLELVLTHPPAGVQQRNGLLVHWLRSAAAARRRVPHALLPTVLELATASRELRVPAAAVLDHRGEWLASQRPDWSWVPDALAGATARSAAAEHVEVDWAQVPSSERLPVLALVRADDPAAARALVESTWRSDSARDRAAHLEALRVGLGPDDENLLERALDDRAASVRGVAAGLLDALPTSGRAERMAARLRPLIHTKGRRGRALEVTLPHPPDAAGVRDGLGKPPPRRSAHGWWLERIVAGAPLDVWEEVTGWDPATTVSRLSDTDALSGIRQAARLRNDPVWAAAVLAHMWDPTLVPALARADREAVVLARLSADRKASPASLLAAVPPPWSAEFSLGVLTRLDSAKAPGLLLAQAMPQLLAGLHHEALPALEAWLARDRDDTAVATQLRTLLQFHSVKRSISEAFR
ncbi:DUF5691 domain-containing protein [Intrasporangium sp.]|uniref:DUF5691 domain-containing protein n=1 Tax=Intrasporangium sp. TaxID=1925024 RepID=UPI00293B3A9D|nr:DUF5691 domain-containing protein [Intrasporangium sp.]MDV3222053.1 DUF5691 domain-containing protein [Intrasporangium sp.]